ncbi:uncharacterized protein FFNC_15337 [Fusarium fujikuroi]|nr:uncharacterized protein FFNC_15337 [Fusarium fujikuroi]
MYLVFS